MRESKQLLKRPTSMRYLVSTLCLVLTASSASAEDALPHHTILRAAGFIAVDGHLDEPSWEAAIP